MRLKARGKAHEEQEKVALGQEELVSCSLVKERNQPAAGESGRHPAGPAAEAAALLPDEPRWSPIDPKAGAVPAVAREVLG
jgi:hypothetical protein